MTGAAAQRLVKCVARDIGNALMQGAYLASGTARPGAEPGR